ncbi:endolysin [Lactococcus phage asccphi28]|uniref:endolysin n=1 Tax=Lactococcus phage asccphi28 TaxID=503388 RepID=UPI000165F86E|nr:endolysin [Lactococcus phage asccphi28]ACA21494.1 unknown [Lactococcus phage asccphi28]
MTISSLTNIKKYEWQSSGHFGGITRKPIDMIVLHHNGGTGSNVVPNCWIEREASAHYQIENGQIINCLDEDITAWHCGAYGVDNNSHTIGIEHQNSTGAPDWLVSNENQEKSAQLVADIAKRYGIPLDRNHIVRHREMPNCNTDCSGGLDIDWVVTRAKQIAGQGGIPAPTPTPTPSNSNPVNPVVTVSYGLRQIGAGWLGTITDFNNSNGNGFAGNSNHEHDMLFASVSHGSLRYRVHTVKSGWLGWVNQGNKNDLVNGCAGNPNEAIDGVQFYYTTPNGEVYKQAYYRSQTSKRAGWLPSVEDDKDFAGILGEPLDRLQIAIRSSNPF